MKPNPNRSSSLSLRQGFGIAIILFGCWQLFGVVVVCIVIPIQIMVGTMKHDGWATIIGFSIGIIIMLFFCAAIIIAGIQLLRDSKGMYIRFLKN